MFEKRKAARARARRDEEWRSLVRAVTDPGGAVSESDERRFLDYLGEDDRAHASSPRHDSRREGRERLTGPRYRTAQTDGMRDGEQVEDFSDGGS